MQTQVLQTRYIERKTLLRFLRELFGENFLVEDRTENYVLTIPRYLTDGEVQAMMADRVSANVVSLELQIGQRVMEDLKRKIESVRFSSTNAYGQHFVPHDKLCLVMTDDSLRLALLDSKVDRHSLDEVIDIIIRGARRIFAILVITGHAECLPRFVREDGFQRAHLDDRIPFDRGLLQKILVDEIVIQSFEEKQGEFTVPVFARSALPRDFHSTVRLPFLEEQYIASGGFGIVYKIKISQLHQLFKPSSNWFIRKEFRPESLTGEFEMELRNLAMLRLLRHPNIVELLGAYTFRGMHNFIFPLANAGDLAKLFEHDRTPSFACNETFFVALAGLGSAIAAVHEYSSEELRAIGCHHDLKPSNILVDDQRFILADFGISRLKSSSRTSATLSKGARGDYLAPECEDLENDCERLMVRRSSDVWAFGCIVAEILTYVLKGPGGIREFKERRRFRTRGLELWRFHCGPNRPSPAVHDWIDNIKKSSQEHELQLALLVETMLSINPEARPRAGVVEKTLFRLAIQALSSPVAQLYAEFLEQTPSIQVLIEYEKFTSWRWACGLRPSDASGLCPSPYDCEGLGSFESVVTGLEDLKSTLVALKSETYASKSLWPTNLRRIGKELFRILPHQLQSRAESHWQQSLLETTNKDQLERISHTDIDVGSENGTGALASIKRMRQLVEEHADTGDSCLIGVDDLPSGTSTEGFSIQTIQTEHQEPLPVILEQKSFDFVDKDHHIENEILTRITNVVRLINHAHSSHSLRVLRCRGAFYDASRSRFGMVYDFPRPSHAETDVTCTLLKSAIEEPTGKQGTPLLGSRFRLAWELASLLFKFHSVGWLHKSISSSIVMFFHPRGSSWTANEHGWRVRGFLHSRLDEETAVSEGLTSDPHLLDYHHPHYLEDLKRGRWRYEPRFDIYSLGVVLLEIGLWRSLGQMTGGWKGNPEALRDKLLHTAASSLGPRTGAMYRDAVICCLNFQSSSTAGASSAALRWAFKEQVVDPLARCQA